MRHARARIARLLVCLLLMQWAAAVMPHARAMARIASAEAVEICTHEGRRSVLLDSDGQPLSEEPERGCCALCFGPASLLPPAPGALAQPVAFLPAPAAERREGLPALPPRAPPQQPRAPPLD